MKAKALARSFLTFAHLDLTKNLEYDRLTKKIMHHVIRPGSNCIDIGCHKGEMLDTILRQSPGGRHFAFEPIPYLFDQLKAKYQGMATILPYALSDKSGSSSFQLVKNAPAYSGIKKRKYDIANPEIEEIQVELRTLDELIPGDLNIDFIKIDVEGAEFNVLKGAKDTIRRSHPVVIFEYGLGAGDYYGTDPGDFYTFLTTEASLKISTLKSFLKGMKPLSLADFTDLFSKNREYYFIAH